jgi:hypothetical protein
MPATGHPPREPCRVPASAASRAFAEHGGQGHSSRAGIMEGDEHATFPPLPGDHHPYAGHPLPDLRPHPRIPARQHQRGPDRALPPGPSRSARHPIPVTGSRLCPAGDSAADVCQPAAQLAAGLGPPARQRSHGVAGALVADAQGAADLALGCGSRSATSAGTELGDRRGARHESKGRRHERRPQSQASAPRTTGRAGFGGLSDPVG